MNEKQSNPFESPTEKSHGVSRTFPQRFSLPITIAVAGVFSILVGCWLGLAAYMANNARGPSAFWYVVMGFIVVGVFVLKGALDSWQNGRLQIVDHRLCGRFMRDNHNLCKEIDLRELRSFQLSEMFELFNSPVHLRRVTKDDETYEFYCKWFTARDYQQLNEVLTNYCPSEKNA